MVEAVGAGWRSGPLVVARSGPQRRRGLRPRSRGKGLVLAARSVHGVGMAEALGVVSLGPDGVVRRASVLHPGRLFYDRGACWVIELPPGRALPPPGMVLEAVARRSSGLGERWVCWHT